MSDRSSTRPTTDGLLGAVAAIAGIVMIVATRELPYVDRTGPGPGLAPAIVGAGLVACGLALIAAAGRIAIAMPRVDRADTRIAVTLGLLLLASVAIDRIGLLLTSMILVFLSARIVAGSPLLHALATSLAVGALLGAVGALLGTPLA